MRRGSGGSNVVHRLIFTLCIYATALRKEVGLPPSYEANAWLPTPRWPDPRVFRLPRYRSPLRWATREDLTLEHLSGLMPAKVRHSDYMLTWLASRWNPSKCSHNLTAPSRAPPLWMEARARLPLRITERAIDVRTHSQIIYCDVFPSRSSSHDSTSRIISFRTSGMLIWCPLATITYLLFAAVAPQR